MISERSSWDSLPTCDRAVSSKAHRAGLPGSISPYWSSIRIRLMRKACCDPLKSIRVWTA